jgi:hypothetical protein
MRAVITHSIATLLTATLAFGAPAAASAAQKELERTGGPYVPTPQVVVDEMLRMGKVGPKDFVIDLGSGDGVIVLTAAKQHKARGVGVDIDPRLVKQSNAEAKRLGIDDRVSFHVQDIFKTDISRATVITTYLLPSMMVNLRPKILLEARPGTRVVSHDYTFDDWKPDAQVTLDVPEKEMVTGVPSATVHLWIVPARAGGKWALRIEGGESYDLVLGQNYQLLHGSAETGGKSAKITNAALRGADITFSIPTAAGRQAFSGRVTDGSMQGTVDLGGGRTARWTAKRGVLTADVRALHQLSSMGAGICRTTERR